MFFYGLLFKFCTEHYLSEIQLVSDGQTDGQTDGPTDGRRDGQTRPLIEMRERI